MVNIVAYYAIGLPVSILLAFHAGFDIEGLLLGLIVAMCIQAVWYVGMVLRLDWEAQAQAAVQHVGNFCRDGCKQEIKEAQERCRTPV